MSGFISKEFTTKPKCAYCWAENEINEKDIGLCCAGNYQQRFDAYFECSECHKFQQIEIPQVVLERIQKKADKYIVKTACCKSYVWTNKVVIKTRTTVFMSKYQVATVECTECQGDVVLASNCIPSQVLEEIKIVHGSP